MLWFWSDWDENIGVEDAPEEIKLGDTIVDTKKRKGIVRYIGGSEYVGVWYGVDLLTRGDVGTCDGYVDGKFLWDPPLNKGEIIQREDVVKAFSGLEAAPSEVEISNVTDLVIPSRTGIPYRAYPLFILAIFSSFVVTGSRVLLLLFCNDRDFTTETTILYFGLIETGASLGTIVAVEFLENLSTRGIDAAIRMGIGLATLGALIATFLEDIYLFSIGYCLMMLVDATHVLYQRAMRNTCSDEKLPLALTQLSLYSLLGQILSCLVAFILFKTNAIPWSLADSRLTAYRVFFGICLGFMVVSWFMALKLDVKSRELFSTSINEDEDGEDLLDIEKYQASVKFHSRISILLLVSTFAFHCVSGAFDIAFPVYLINQYNYPPDRYTHTMMMIYFGLGLGWTVLIPTMATMQTKQSKLLVIGMCLLSVGIVIFIIPPMGASQLVFGYFVFNLARGIVVIYLSSTCVSTLGFTTGRWLGKIAGFGVVLGKMLGTSFVPRHFQSPLWGAICSPGFLSLALVVLLSIYGYLEPDNELVINMRRSIKATRKEHFRELPESDDLLEQLWHLFSFLDLKIHLAWGEYDI